MPIKRGSGSAQEAAAKGMQGIQKMLEQKLREAEMLTKEGLEDVVKEIEFESNLRVPVDTRALMDSSYKQVTDLGGGKLVGEVGYDRKGEAPYASLVHEITDNVHPIGESHFLQKGSDVVEKDIKRILQKSLNSLFK